MKNITIDVVKVDVEELISNLKVQNVDTFTSYLKEIWRVNKIFNFLRTWLIEATIN
jgi:hypothetical protein